MTPRLVKWYEKYSPQGFTILEVYNGPADRQFGIGPEDIKKHIDAESVRFPVFYDSEAATCDAYEVRGYPSRFLLGRDGKVVWQDPWGNAAQAERMIEQALLEHAN